MFEASRQVVFVELDVLLDTRLGTLVKMDQSIMGKIDPTEYRTRKNDRFDLLEPSIDLKAFKEAYMNRDVDTLKCSLMSGAMLAISAMQQEMVKTAFSEKSIEEIRVDVNVYPYRLTDDILEEYQMVIGSFFPDNVEVRMISLHPVFITPDLLKRDYALFITYELNTWLELHWKALVESGIPTVTVAGPKLFLDQVPSKEILEDAGFSDANKTYGFLEYTFAPYVTLSCLDIKYFSMIAL